MKIQLLLINTPFAWNDGISYFSWLIRKVTGSFWNHLAIRYTTEDSDNIIQAIGKGVFIQSYEDFLVAGNRTILPRDVVIPCNLDKVLAHTDRMYGWLDLPLILLKIGVNRYIDSSWKGWNDKRGTICSELGCELFGIDELLHPGQFEHMPGMISQPIFKTYRGIKPVNSPLKTLSYEAMSEKVVYL